MARTDASLQALQTSLRSECKWTNVQSVLLERFGEVASVLEAQEQLIQTLQRRVDELERVTTVEHVAVSGEQVRVDVKRRVARLRKEISISLEQQQTTIKQVEEKVEQKATQGEEAAAKVEGFELRCCKVEQGLSHLAASMNEKIDAQNVKLGVLEAKMEEQKMEIEEQIVQFKEQNVQMKTQRALDNDRLSELCQDAAKKVNLLESKFAESETTREAAVGPAVKEDPVASPVDTLHEDLARVSKDLREVESRMEKQCISWRQELAAVIGKKLCKSEATKLLSRKMDTMDAWKQLAEKADSARVEEVAGALMDSIQRSQESTIDELDQLRQICEGKADTFELVQVKHNTHNLVAAAESIQHELSAVKRITNEKMTVADAKELIDSQATLNVLEEARKQVEGAVAGEFATKSQLDTVAHQVQAITRQLRSEIYQARYIWKDGRPSAKQTILWSSQVVNTNADIFLWQFGSDEVRLLLPGLYHLQAAFFTNYSPTIQVLVNGEPGLVLRSPSDTRAPTSSSSSGLRRLHHSAGNVAGLGIDAFLALPARAQVAISYDLDEKAQGFLNLRKL